MTTTHLFVELLVIGFGASVWLALLGLALFGPLPKEWLQTFSSSFTLVFPALSVVYVMGILVDRAADRVFHRWDKRHLKELFPDEEDKKAYYNKRRTMVVYGKELWEHLEYGRSRLRICRGWALNSVATLLALDFCAVIWVSQSRVFLSFGQVVICSVFLLIFAAACFVSWRSLNRTEYEKIDRQADWIAKMEKIEGKADVREPAPESRSGTKSESEPGSEPESTPIQD